MIWDAFFERLPRPSFRPTLSMRIAQSVLILLGIAGAAGHAFFKSDYSRTLNLDIVTVVWIGLAVVGFILPEIYEFGFGDRKFNLRIRASAEDIAQVLVDVANLAQSWSTAIAIYITMMQKPSAELPESKDEVIRKYIRDRMGEAKLFLGDRPGELVRIALWLHFVDAKEVRFAGIVMGGAPPTKTIYAVGEGTIGQALAENKDTGNGAEPPYKAVLCQAVRWNNQPIGMLTIDKEGEAGFSTIAADIAKGLASQCAMALVLYAKNREL